MLLRLLVQILQIDCVFFKEEIYISFEKSTLQLLCKCATLFPFLSYDERIGVMGSVSFILTFVINGPLDACFSLQCSSFNSNL